MLRIVLGKEDVKIRVVGRGGWQLHHQERPVHCDREQDDESKGNWFLQPAGVRIQPHHSRL